MGLLKKTDIGDIRVALNVYDDHSYDVCVQHSVKGRCFSVPLEHLDELRDRELELLEYSSLEEANNEHYMLVSLLRKVAAIHDFLPLGK